MTSIQKVFQRKKTPTELESEQFEKNQGNHISKAVNSTEGAPKEKHIRAIILGTFHYGSASLFFKHINLNSLQSNPIICWKYLYVIHKIMRDGHEQAMVDVIKNERNVKELGNLWGHLKSGYGSIISAFCKLLTEKNKFHKKYRGVPGNLVIQNDEAFQLGKNIDSLFELTLDILDYLEELVSFEQAVINSLDKSKSNSMTPQGQCRLTPLIQIIQDIATLYDISVRLLFKLHSKLDLDLLSGHRQRFLKLFDAIKVFFKHAQTFQYFKTLIQVPALPENPPNFLLESDLVAQKALVVNVTEEPDIELVNDSPPPEKIDSLINFDNVDINDKFDKIFGEMNTFAFSNNEREELLKEIEYLKSVIERMKAEHSERVNSLLARIRVLEEEVKGLVQLKDQYEERIRHYEMQRNDVVENDKYNKIKEAYGKLREEHVKILRQQGLSAQQIENQRKEFEVIQKELEEKRNEFARLEMENLLYMSTKKDIGQCNHELAEAQSKLKEMERTKFELMAKNKNLESKSNELNKQLELLQAQSDEEKQSGCLKVSQLQSELNNLRSNLGQNSDIQKQLQEKIQQLEHRLKMEEDTRLKLTFIYDNLLNQACRNSQRLIKNTHDSLLSEDYSTYKASPELLIALVDDTLREITAVKSVNMSNLESSEVRMKLADSIYNFGFKLSDSLLQAKLLNNDSGNLYSEINSTNEKVFNNSINMLDCIFNGKDHNSNSGQLTNDLTHLKELAIEVKKINLALSNETNEDLFDEELRNTMNAIQLAEERFKMILEQNRSKFSGIQLEVNEKIIDSCSELMYAIKILIDRSKTMQAEIISAGKESGSVKDFYKKHHKWTEGLISAAKAVGAGATWLCEAADNLLTNDGKFEDLVVCAREITASTTQLVFSSRVKADLTSVNFKNLSQASKNVSDATGKVIANAKNAMTILEEKGTYDFSKLTLTQARRLEMDSQIKVIELEADLEKERKRLGDLRKKHYSLAGEVIEENEDFESVTFERDDYNSTSEANHDILN